MISWFQTQMKCSDCQCWKCQHFSYLLFEVTTLVPFDSTRAFGYFPAPWFCSKLCPEEFDSLGLLSLAAQIPNVDLTKLLQFSPPSSFFLVVSTFYLLLSSSKEVASMVSVTMVSVRVNGRESEMEIRSSLSPSFHTLASGASSISH